MVCSQTGGMTVGAEGGVTMVGMVSGGLAVDSGGGGGVEASESAGEGVSGDTRPLGAADMVVGGS